MRPAGVFCHSLARFDLTTKWVRHTSAQETDAVSMSMYAEQNKEE